MLNTGLEADRIVTPLCVLGRISDRHLIEGFACVLPVSSEGENEVVLHLSVYLHAHCNLITVTNLINVIALTWFAITQFPAIIRLS